MIDGASERQQQARTGSNGGDVRRAHTTQVDAILFGSWIAKFNSRGRKKN
jgi:hypothetical protein